MLNSSDGMSRNAKDDIHKALLESELTLLNGFYIGERDSYSLLVVPNDDHGIWFVVVLQRFIFCDSNEQVDFNRLPIRIIVNNIPSNKDIFYKPTLAQRRNAELQRLEIEYVLGQAFPECSKSNFPPDEV